MILLDDKRVPPPPYPSAAAPRRRDPNAPNLSTLPPHILLHIVEVTFPPCSQAENHRRNLYWLSVSLRLVCRGLYIACMHTLRSTYLASYSQLVRPPYTSDPFPVGSAESSDCTSTSPFPIQSLQRETEILDLFVALKAREDVLLDESGLHLEREGSFQDLFSLMQPRRRTEDLVRHYGLRYGVVALSDAAPYNPSRIPFSRLSVSFSTRKVGLVLVTPPTKIGSRHLAYKRNTIIECTRDKNDKLEVVAKNLAKELRRWIANRQ